ncbi:MAG: hypothetical protein RL616_1016, partial [Verrucomicrobiota bacterium]
FAAPLLAAFALANIEKIRRQFIPLGAVLLALIGGIIFWTQHAPLPGDETHAALQNGISRAAFLLLTGAVLFALTRAAQSPLLRCAPLALLLVTWLDVVTHQPKQNPTVSPAVFELNLARTKLAMNPQPELGGSRAMLSPDAALELTRFAASDAKNNFLAKRLGYCANANLLDNVPKVDGFFSLTPRESDGLLATTYGVTNGSFTRLEEFMGVSQFSSSTNLLAWEPRQHFLPLVTAGQRPVFVDDASMDSPFLAHPEFDGGKMVFLPASARSLVTVTNQTVARILNSKFTTQTVDAEVEAAEPSLVVVAQTYYHNWRVTIDGQPAPLLRANVAFQAVQVPAGKHRLHFFYQDRAFQIGVTISGMAWLVCFGALLAGKRR